MTRPINIAGNATNKEKKVIPSTFNEYSPIITAPEIIKTSLKTSHQCFADELIILFILLKILFKLNVTRNFIIPKVTPF